MSKVPKELEKSQEKNIGGASFLQLCKSPKGPYHLGSLASFPKFRNTCF